MKILHQKTLYFSEGKSDKVYEVDLCESGSDLYIVNFRYGRRGANLREGTKTVFPVPYEEALKVFNSLVASKEKKGYSETLSETSEETKTPSQATEINTAREQTILKYLKEAVAGVYTRNWKVSRIVWRAADLNITKAIPSIVHFINSEDAFEQYASIHALSKFKDVSGRDAIYNVYNTLGFKDKVGRIAAAYILKLGKADYKNTVIQSAINNLPEELKGHIGDYTSFFNALAVYFLKEKDIDASMLYYIYLLSIKDEVFRKQLYIFIEKAPLKVNLFKSIRYIYRASHALEDTIFFALTSKRIAVSKPSYTSDYLYVDNEWTDADVEKQKPNPTIAFSKKTKDYFNKTTYKYVYELSKSDTVTYIDYASALLISLNDTLDNVKEDIQYHYNYNQDTRRYTTERRIFPKYHDFLALMYIVYGGASRLQRQNNKWFYIEGDNTTTPIVREEVLPELWNTKPEKVLYVLANAKSDIAITFALRIIKENNHFLDNISLEQLTQLVGHYHPKVLDVILNIVKQRYASTKPENAIVLALLKSDNEDANTLAFNWLKQYEAEYFTEATFISQLLLTGKEAVVSYIKNLYTETAKYNLHLSIATIELLFKIPSQYTFEYLVQVNDLIGNTYFGSLLSSVPEEKIKTLAKSSAVSNKLFAANLAKQNTASTYLLFKDSIDDYINSDNAELRQVGIELLSHFPDEFLLENHQKISGFCFSEYNEVRNAIQPTVEKLIALDDNFKNNLFKALLRAIETAETYEGLHENCYTLLTTNYKPYLGSIPQEAIFSLILSQYDYAQKLGEPLFAEHITLETLPVKTIVSLAHSDIFSIRTLLKHYFEKHTSTINIQLEDALLVFNSHWEDVIEWACQYFETHIKPEYWTVNMLLYACDHTKTEVQHFGRKMITQHFSEDKGLPLLLKLQEHPTKTMQFFVTNYLDNYAKGNTSVILKLETFFKTSLFNINTNRVTKTRIYKFLEEESVKDKAVAEMTVRLVNSILGTNTMLDNSNNIDLLLTITETYPDIEVPLLIKQN